MEQEIKLVDAFIATPRSYKVTELEVLSVIPESVSRSPVFIICPSSIYESRGVQEEEESEGD